MNRWLVLAGLLSAACAPPPSGNQGPPPQATATAAATPDYSQKTQIGLLRPTGKVKVGDPVERGFEVFSQPRRYEEFRDLPASLGEPYEALGWQNISEGFGVITYQDKVAAAFYQIERADEERLQRMVASYERDLGRASETIDGEFVRYWFWEERPHRLMVCAVRQSSGSLHLTSAMGDTRVLEPLGVSPDAARADRLRAETIFRERKALKSSG